MSTLVQGVWGTLSAFDPWM